MPHVKYKAKTSKQYCGFDGNKIVSMKAGEVLYISDAKIKQLLEDFPQDFEEIPESDASTEIKKSESERYEAQKNENEAFQKKKGRGRPPKAEKDKEKK
jgi:hypothetical protein